MNRHPRTLLAPAALLSVLLAACAGESTSPTASAPSLRRDGSGADAGAGAVYTLTNAPSGNAVLAFRRSVDGALTSIGSFATGGRGTGGAIDPLQSQHALVLDDGHHTLFAVDAGSNEVSSFRVGDGGGLTQADRASSGGVRPVSLAYDGKLLYVLNAGDNSLSGFRVSGSGHLAAVPHSTRSLAPGAAGASTVRFSADGRWLIVSERMSNRLETFAVGANGRLGEPVITASHGMTPFGFDVTGEGNVLVSEAAGAAPNGAASSYRVGSGGALAVITGSLDQLGMATCWLLASHDSRYAYAVNSASGTIGVNRVAPNGTLTLLAPGGALASAGPVAPIDPALSADDRFLFTLNGATGTVTTFRVNADHGLTAQGTVPVGPAAGGLQGLAAF